MVNERGMDVHQAQRCLVGAGDVGQTGAAVYK